MAEQHHHMKSLGVRDMTLFTVSAILLGKVAIRWAEYENRD